MVSNSEGLDSGLLDVAVQYVCSSDLGLIHIKEIYRHLEENYEFSDKQLEIHKQSVGQQEPNWMHDLRNLMGNQSPNWRIINPRPSHWGCCNIPQDLSEDFFAKLYDSMVKQASENVQGKKRLPIHRMKEGWFIVESYNSEMIIIQTNEGKMYNLGKKLAIKHISHLYYCGGTIQVGKLHRYRAMESAMIHFCPKISTDGESVFFRKSK